MKFEVFSELVNTLQKLEEKSFAANQLGIDLIEYETDFTKATWLAIRSHYGKEASEWIEWFIYERISLSGEVLKAWDENGIEICSTVESLWQTIEEMRLSPTFKEYELPIVSEFSADEIKDKIANFFKPKNNETEN